MIQIFLSADGSLLANNHHSLLLVPISCFSSSENKVQFKLPPTSLHGRMFLSFLLASSEGGLSAPLTVETLQRPYGRDFRCNIPCAPPLNIYILTKENLLEQEVTEAGKSSLGSQLSLRELGSLKGCCLISKFDYLLLNSEENSINGNTQERIDLIFLRQNNINCSDQSMIVFIRQFSGKEVTVQVELTDTIDRVKQRIQEKEGIPHNCQRLIYAGKGLQGDKTLADYQVQAESVIHLVTRLPGA